MALVERYNQYADAVVDVQVAYDFIHPAVLGFGSNLDSYSLVIDQDREEFAFAVRRDAAELLIEDHGLMGRTFVIVPIHPLCWKLAGLFGKAFIPMAMAVKLK